MKTKTEKNERRRHKRIERQMNSSKLPRSPNRFMLYRKYIQDRINTDPNKPANMRDLSKMVAQMWEKEPPEVKQYWDQVAERIKLNSSYRSSFDVINGLDMSISESDITIVNATASSPTIPNPILAENFIMESPESNIPQIPPSNPSRSPPPQSPQSPFFPQSPLSPQSSLSLQLSSDEDPSFVSSPPHSINQDFNHSD